MPVSKFQAEENNTGITKYQVQDNINNDKIIRHQVMLEGGGGSTPVLESLNVTTNGTYTPGEGIDGYNEVNVNIPDPEPIMPEETLVSEFAMTGASTYPFRYDRVRDLEIQTGNYNGMTINNDGYAEMTARSGYIKTEYPIPTGIPTKVIIDFGEFNKTYDYTNNERNVLFSFQTGTPMNKAMLTYIYKTTEQYYWLRDQSGNNQYIQESDPYYFENKKIIAVWSGILRNGHVYRYSNINGNVRDYLNYWSLYLEDGSILNEGYLQLGYDSNDLMSYVTIGSPSGYGFIGAAYKNVKIYQINELNTYEEE